MADNEETASGAKPESNARERLRARTGRTKPATPKTPPRRATPRPAAPTRSIEPGLVHFRIAEGILKGVKERAAERGVDLDVGEFPELDSTGGEADDPQKLAKLTAHAVARVADRFTFARKITRHFEGSEKRAGILSDIFAALYTLWRRNPEQVEAIAKGYAAALQERRTAVQAERASEKASDPQTHNGGAPTHAPV